jgi:DnaJ-class molecular chaperone
MKHTSNWTSMDDTSNDGRVTERPCPHCKGRWPEMDQCVTCEGDGTVLVRSEMGGHLSR